MLVLGNESEIVQSLEYLLRGAVKVSKRDTEVQLRVSLDTNNVLENEHNGDVICCFSFGTHSPADAAAAGHLMIPGDENAEEDVRSLGMLSICIVDTGPGGNQVRDTEARFMLSIAFNLNIDGFSAFLLCVRH